MQTSSNLVFALALVAVGCSTDPDYYGLEGLDAELRSTFPAALGGASALSADAQIVSANEGFSVPEAESHLQAQDVFDDLVADLHGAYTSLADAEFADVPGGSSTIWFKGAVPSGAESVALGSGVPVNLVGGYSMSFDEMELRTDDIADELLARGYTGFSVAFVGDATFEVHIGSNQPPLTLPDPLAAGVTVTYSPTPSSGFYTTCGGAEMESSGGNLKCTAGFTVEHNDSRLGVSSAGHCSGPSGTAVRLDNENGSTKDTISLEDAKVGNQGDAGWYTSSGTVRAEFWGDNNTLYKQESRARAYSRNSSYCAYGRVTNVRQCSKVFRTSVVVSDQGLTARRLLAFDDDFSVQGDSGGPVSRATRAGGIISGFSTINGVRRGTASKVSRLDNALDVRVFIP